MKKFLIILLPVLLFLQFSVFAQEIKRCITPEMNKRMEQAHPEFAQGRKQLETFTKAFLSNPANKTNEIYIIPIVFHIVHNNGTENISKAQVLDAVRILNEDFRKRNSDTTQIVSAFLGVAADSRIEFRLAQKDPSGNCTEGITRVASPLSVNADDNTKYADPAWDRSNYFNVWVVKSVSGAAGYSYYPSYYYPPAEVDGVIINHEYIGSIGTGSSQRSRALTHEIGHSFNLMHTWGDSNEPGLPENCSNSDEVSDTPPTIGHTSCNLTANTCGQLDNVQNYMEYAYCDRMFTYGQKDRMRAALNSTASERNNLWQQATLLATGTNDGYTAPECAPIAEFDVDHPNICQGLDVQFFDMSYNADIDGTWSWNWSFPGGTPASSTQQNPVISYATPGLYDATLTVSNSSGSDLVSKSDVVAIASSTQGLNPPFNEGIEYSGFPLHQSNSLLNWTIISSGNYTWVRNTSAAASGSASVRIRNWGNDPGIKNYLISPNIIMPANIQSVLFTFKQAYAKKTTTSNDYLKVYASNDCGATWTMRWARSGTSLSTNGGVVVSNTFIPTAGEWRQETVTLSTLAFASHLMFKFEMTSGDGNYLYLDDINMTIVTSNEPIAAPTEVVRLEVFPNPSGSDISLHYSLPRPGGTTIELYDIAGKIIETQTHPAQPGGSYNAVLSTSEKKLPAGFYFVKFTFGNTTYLKKVVVE